MSAETLPLSESSKPPEIGAIRMPKPSGRFRQGLLIVAVACAFALIPLDVYAIFAHHKLTIFLSRLDGTLSILSPLALAFLLSDLLGEFRGYASPIDQPWTDKRHFTFVCISCFLIASALPIFYFFAVHMMVGPVVGGQD